MPKRESCGSVLPCGWPPLDPMPSTAPTCNPHRACCTAGCRTHRDFVPWRFSAAGRHAAWLGRHPGGRKPAQCTIGDIRAWPENTKPTRRCANLSQRSSRECGRRDGSRVSTCAKIDQIVVPLSQQSSDRVAAAPGLLPCPADRLGF
jgi:hypothetical protein